jgi:hypothetical protein
MKAGTVPRSDADLDATRERRWLWCPRRTRVDSEDQEDEGKLQKGDAPIFA